VEFHVNAGLVDVAIPTWITSSNLSTPPLFEPGQTAFHHHPRNSSMMSADSFVNDSLTVNFRKRRNLIWRHQQYIHVTLQPPLPLVFSIAIINTPHKDVDNVSK
jgi:hypothetical protein